MSRRAGAGAAGVGPADWDWPLGYRDGLADGRLELESAGWSGGCRGVTSRPAGTGDHLVPVPVFSWRPGYRDEPPGGCRGCAGRDATSRPAGTGDHLGQVPPGSALPIGVCHRFPGTGVCRSGGWLSRWDTCLMSVPGWPGCRAGAGHRTYPHELMNGERLCGSGLGIKECLGDQEVYDDRRRVRERNCY